MARDGAASYEIGRTNLDGGMGDDYPNTTGRPKRPIIFAWIFAAVIRRGEPARREPRIRPLNSGPAVSEGN